MTFRACASALLFTAFAAGCGPRLDIVEPRCRPVAADGQPPGLAFSATIDTRGYTDQQIVYRIRLLDSRLRPVRSTTRPYTDAESNVAATKSLMVLRSPWTFEDTTVTIPGPELELKPEDLPAHAEFAILSARGELLARAIQRVPAGVGPEIAAAPPEAPLPEPPEPPAPAARADEPAPPRDLFTALYEAYERQQRSAANREFPAPDPQDSAADESAADADPAESAPSPPAAAASSADQARDGASEVRAPEESGEAAVPPAADRGAGARYRIYVVQEGDTLTRIAKRLYGDTARWVDIFQLNRDRLDSPDLIYEGMQIRVPRDD